jgi:hypothetical protein
LKNEQCDDNDSHQIRTIPSQTIGQGEEKLHDHQGCGQQESADQEFSKQGLKECRHVIYFDGRRI